LYEGPRQKMNEHTQQKGKRKKERLISRKVGYGQKNDADGAIY